jgi:hypothetical protein
MMLEASMWFKHRAWIPVAWLLSLVNLVSVWFAARPAEPAHATLHAVLAAAFAVGAQRLTARQRTAMGDDLQQALDDNERLQQTLEAMQPRMEELEERVDFAERLLATQRESEPRDAPPR